MRGRVAEVEAGGHGKVGLEHEGELREHALASGAGVGDEEARLGRVVHALGGADELADLGGGGPHGALAASDGRGAVAVKELVGDEGAT